MNSITHNIIRTTHQLNTAHLLTDYAESLFDSYLSNIDGILTFPININYSPFIDYDLILSHNPIMLSTKSKDLSSLHINMLLYFHSVCPNNFKKEDKFLLKNSINKHYKIFTDNNCMKTWGFDQQDDRCYVINYGIIPPNKQNINKTRSVIVLNLNNNQSINVLFQNIKNIFTDAVIVNSTQDINLNSYLQQSAVCIEAESAYNIINALAHKCYVISALEHISEDGLFFIDSYELIIDKIKNTIKQYNDNDAENYARAVCNKYSHQKFQESFIQIIQQVKKEPYQWLG